MRPAPSYVRTVLFLIMAVLIGVLYVTLPPLRLKLYGEAVATVPAPISTLAPAPTLPPTSTPTPTPDIALSLSGAQIMRGGQPVRGLPLGCFLKPNLSRPSQSSSRAPS